VDLEVVARGMPGFFLADLAASSAKQQSSPFGQVER
jgi:hypothetical protein